MEHVLPVSNTVYFRYVDNSNISGMYTLSMYEVYTNLDRHIMGYTYLKNIHIPIDIYIPDRYTYT